MSKLAVNRMWAPEVQKPLAHQTIIIFDWDDTLMSSTFLSPFQNQIMSESVRAKLPKIVIAQLEALEKQVIHLLKRSVQVAQTFIITNAGQGWVELSSMRFLPKLYKEIIEVCDDLGLQIISARSMFEKDMPSKIILS